jgi:hypothetical protein
MSKVKFYVLPLLVTILLLTVQNKTAHAGSNRIAGTWIVNGTFDPESGLPPFVNIVVFTTHGTVVNVDPVDGTGVGQWQKIGDHDYSVIFMGFTVIDGQSLMYRVRSQSQHLSESGNEFNAPFTTEILDGNGSIMFSVSGTVHAVRAEQ